MMLSFKMLCLKKCFKIELNFNRIRKYPMYLINMTITSVYNMAHRERMDCELRVSRCKL